MLCLCAERSEPSVTGGAEGDFGRAERPITQHFQMLHAGQVPLEWPPLPGGFWGVCVVFAEKEECT